eukprot:NODE_2620_length_413_cov_69.670330_g2539_i0.p2 GENE.NODE_2620_length_413_cov_69.670330_g2539_i0~~NODE_2620_length_413_cov_69.670330_g2539_i0.p2  ORF type:complete len:58 (-),score=10.00 NODE_2620_length_413_cov_69.670330_g2539_i0:215-388(-)
MENNMVWFGKVRPVTTYNKVKPGAFAFHPPIASTHSPMLQQGERWCHHRTPTGRDWG